MAITPITTPATAPANRTQPSRDAEAPRANGGRPPRTDTVTLGQQPDEAVTYTGPRKAAGTQQQPDVASLLAESDRKAQEMIDLLQGLIQKQGLTWSKVVSGEQRLSADAESIDAARQAISEDGEFGVKKTAERILSFARLGIGDDPAKIATMREAVEKGFNEAKEMLGGNLPEISQKTHDAIMAEFDRWEKEGLPARA